MQAHLKKKSFYGRKLNKVPCIIFTIWGKMNFLGTFNVKTQRITRQKNQNRARYTGAFWGKITFFWRKNNKVHCIIDAILGKFNFLGISAVKTHYVIGQKSQIVLNMQVHFEEIIIIFGRKVNKVSCIIVKIRVKIILLGIFTIKYTGLLGYKVKILLDMLAHFAEKITLFGRKVNKYPVI